MKIRVICAALQGFSLLGVLAGNVAANECPNILFFLVDDMGVTDCSVSFLQDAQGEMIRTPLNERYRTPNMRRLAHQGIRFCNAYAYSVCTPTRVSLLSGIEAPRLRITTWTHPQESIDTGAVNEGGLQGPKWRFEGLDPRQTTLPRVLSNAGYRTIHCGKAHFGPNDTPSGEPTNLGFDMNIAGHGAGGVGSHLGKHNYSAQWRDGGSDWDVPDLERYHGTETHLTEALTLEMKATLADAVSEKRPFFAYMSHYTVHAPFEVDTRFAGNYPDLEGKDLAFATMIEGMDKSLGDLLDCLEELGVAEETLVVFYSDNGSDGPPNLPLRGIKGSRYMGGNRVPLIVAWAKENAESELQQTCPIPAGVVEDDLVAPVDFLPTIANLTGIPVPDDLQADGHDLTPYLKGLPGTHRPQQLLVHFPHGRHRSHLYTTWTDGDWKLTYEYAPSRWHLHNLHYDIGEEHNLVEQHPKLALAMAERMIQELDERQALYPAGRETGASAKPDLSVLKEVADDRTHADDHEPFPEDDLNLSAMIQPVSEHNFFRDEGWYTWCSSIIKGDDDKYHLFYVRWPKQHGYYAWLTHSEIARAVSDHPAGPYSFVATVKGSRGTHSWNAINAHNVKIKRFDGKYYLYFIGQNDGGRGLTEQDLVDTAKGAYRSKYWRLLRNNQRTGVAMADSLEGPWTVHPTTVVEPRGMISTITVNPAVWQAHDGDYHIIVKGDHPHGRLAQAHGVSNSAKGPFVLQQAPAFTGYSEDMSVWQDPNRRLTYGILHDGQGFGLIVSRDSYNWQQARHFRVTGRTILQTNGDSLSPKRLERPSVYCEDGCPRVLSGGVQFDEGDACVVLIPLDQHWAVR